LQVHEVFWKKLGPYNLKCRKIVCLQPQLQPDNSGSTETAMAMETSSTPTAAAAAAAAAGPEAMQHDGNDSTATTFKQQQQQQQQAGPTSHPGLLLNSITCSNSATGTSGHSLAVTGSTGSSVQQQQQHGGGGAIEYVLKFETQMYKIRDDEYAIDVQVGADGPRSAGCVSVGC
jgi:hypothetical protein